MDKNFIILSCVGVYMLLCIVIGLWAMRRTKSTHDFFMAGRSLGVVITAVAMFSSIMSGFGFVGGPGLVYRMGVSSFWIVICTPIGFSLTFYLLGTRLRMLAELKDSVSLPDVAEARYGSRAVRFFVALSILFGVIAYLATQIKAMAFVLREIAVNNSLSGGDSILICVVISSAVLVFYCVTGGIIASVYTDLFQGLVMIGVAVAVFATAVTRMEGGLSEVTSIVIADNPEAAGPWGTLGMLGCLSWLFLFMIGGVGQPHVVSKLMMSRRVEDARHALPLTVLGYTLTSLLWISIGLLMRAAVLSGAHDELGGADEAASAFLYHYAPPVLAGLAFAGLFAAIMSTADSFLNIGAAAIVHDIPQSIRGRSVANELWWARVATIALAVFAAIFAMSSPHELVGQLGAFGWGVFASALTPVIGIGLSWKAATPTAAVVSMAISLAVNLSIVAIQLAGYSIPYGVAGGAIALAASLLTFVVISHFSKPVKIDESVEAVMDI